MPNQTSLYATYVSILETLKDWEQIGEDEILRSLERLLGYHVQITMLREWLFDLEERDLIQGFFNKTYIIRPSGLRALGLVS